MSLFFVSRVFFVLQFNISSRNSAQKDGGRPHDLRATNSRIRGEERRGKKKERIPARWVNCLRPISTSWNRGRMNGEHWKEKVLTIFLVRIFEIFSNFSFSTRSCYWKFVFIFSNETLIRTTNYFDNHERNKWEESGGIEEQERIFSFSPHREFTTRAFRKPQIPHKKP